MPAEQAVAARIPEMICKGDMGGGKGFYIHSNSSFAGENRNVRYPESLCQYPTARLRQCSSPLQPGRAWMAANSERDSCDALL